jgi:DNA-binding Xre family transcriptional regulator
VCFPQTITLYCANVQIIGQIKNYIEKANFVNYTNSKYADGHKGGMEMNSLFPNLQAAMEQRGVSSKDIADVIGLSEEIVRLKMRGIRDWKLTEALAICRYLHHPDFHNLFLR